MDINLKGKHAVICGSTQGIGRAVAIELASLGTNVILVARNEASLSKVKEELSTGSGQDHGYIVADFNNPEQLRERINDYVSKNPPVHILVNNTGGPAAGPITEAKTDEFVQGFSNHLVCNHILAQAVIPGMKSEGYGRIINIISTSVKQPLKGLGVSNTIRGAVASWAKTLAGELGAFGITVNNVLPGATDTARLASLFSNIAEKTGKSLEDVKQGWTAEIPAGRIAKPEELAYAVAFLASPSAAYINGVSLPVDGGRIMGL